MSSDPTNTTTRVIAAAIKSDPRLADPSRYVKAFASFLNDRQPEAEKSTPETEWRRMRDLWGGLRILGKGLVAMTRELETQKKLSVDYQKVFDNIDIPSDDPFDPVNGSGARSGGGGGGFGSTPATNLINVLDRIRSTMSDLTQQVLANQGQLDLYVPGIHQIAEDFAQFAADAKARIDSIAGGGGGGSVDNPMTSDLDAGGFFIHNMADAVAPNDGTTLGQVGALDATTLTNAESFASAGDATTLATAEAFATAADTTLAATLIHKDGSVAFTADQPMGTHKITGLANGTASTDAVNKGQMDAGDASSVSTAEAFATAADATQLALLIKKDGSVAFTGDQSLGSHKLTNVTDPASAQDAATKAYADAGDALSILKDGTRAFTGAQSMGSHKLTNVTDPTAAQDAATKAYVDAGDVAGGASATAYTDALAATVLKKDGSVSATGDLNLNSHKLTNVTDPTSAQDAATKTYADLKIPKSTLAAKGDILCASASATATVLTVGANNRTVIASSSKSNGLDYGGVTDEWFFEGTGVSDNRYDGAGFCQAFGTAFATTVDTIFLYPFFVKRPLIFNKIGCKVTVLAAGSKIRVGIYSTTSKSDLTPSALIYGSAELAGTSTGSKEDTPGAGSVTISTPGLYYFAVLTGTLAPTLQTIGVASIPAVLGMDSAVTGRATGWTRAFSYAALPDPLGGSPALVSQAMPQAFIRISGSP